MDFLASKTLVMIFGLIAYIIALDSDLLGAIGVAAVVYSLLAVTQLILGLRRRRLAAA